MMAFLNWIKQLGHPIIELKCDQEPTTIDVRNALIKRCQGTQLVPFATPKGSNGSLGAGERAHLAAAGKMRSIRHFLETKYQVKIGPDNLLIPWLIRHISWLLDRFQTKKNGKTAYESMRGKPYKRQVIPFGEIAQFRILTDDKLSLIHI